MPNPTPIPTDLVTSEQAYRNFIDACRSSKTRYLYKKSLDYFMSYLRIPLGVYNKLLEMDSKITQANIIDYIAFLRKSKSSASVMMYLAAIRKFYMMNDISLNWDRIHSYQGEHEKDAEDRPYTHSEVQRMISHTSIRNRAIILTLWSSGMRVGAIPPLRIKDLEPIEKYNIYKITVYAKSKRSSYRTYCSPECKVAIDQYLSWRSRWGDKLHEDEPLFRQDFNTSTPTTKKQQGTSAMSMSQNGLEFLEGHEGNAGMLPAARRLTRDNYGLYNDPAGHCTVGVGHLVHRGPCTRQDINNYRAEYPNGLGRDGALQQLAADLGIAEAAVRQHVNVDLTQEQFDALVSFTFNVGEGNLQISRLLRHINAGQCDGQTITGDFHRFLRAGDNPNALLNRWNAEINLFNNGSY